METLLDFSKLSLNDYEIDNRVDNDLTLVLKYLKLKLDDNNLQKITNYCHSIKNYCIGNGAGLTGGTISDLFLCEFFKNILDEYQEYKKGEADIKICNIPLSVKKINGKSTIALSWSKNKFINDTNFIHHILIINLKTEKWWKNMLIIKSGIYLVDKDFCKANIELYSNNKTDKLINSKNLYKMLEHSIEKKLFIELPEKNKDIIFSILTGFSE